MAVIPGRIKDEIVVVGNHNDGAFVSCRSSSIG
mgnify:CR=1 FL=1